MNDLMLAVVICLGGLLLLVKSADIMIDGALVVAQELKLSKMLIGSTLLAFGTSAPEMVVNFLASYQGKGDIVVGNIIGSNLVNLVWGIGGVALFMPLAFTKRNMAVDYPLGILGVLFFFCGSVFFGLSHWVIGGVLVAVFALYLWHALRSDEFDLDDGETHDMSMRRACIYSVLGLAGLLLGGKFAVDGAVEVADILKINEAVIALTVIAIGTSAPEVITCIQAARRGHGDIAIGNIAGSQIFNGLWVLGGSSIIARVSYDDIIYQDLGLLVLMTLPIIFLAGLFRGRGHRYVGGMMIVIYLVYLAYIIVREIYI